jgi:transposase
MVADACGHCGTDVSSASQRCRHRYDHIHLPPIRPVVTRVELFGGRCGGCGRRYRAEAPAGMQPGTPFGPGIRSLLAYLNHSHHVGFERLSRLADEMFGLTISEGAIANIFRRMGQDMVTATSAICEKLRGARIIASDETTTRTNGVIQWQWVFISDQAVLHKVASSRARRVAAEVLGDHRPDVWVSDRYAGHRIWPGHIKSASPMFCATFGMPSTAATRSSRQRSAIICDGRPGSAGDDTISRTVPW